MAYTESKNELGIPYHREPNDPKSHSYIDLKRELHRIEEIPELRDEPALRELVIRLNKPNGSMRSFGCERWHKAPSNEKEAHQFGSYVAFAIDAWPFEQKQATEAIFLSFVEHESARPLPEEIKMCFDLRPTILYDEEIRGWSIDVWVWGFGETRDIAHDHWYCGINRLDAFIEAESRRWHGMLAVTAGPTSPAGFEIIKQQDLNYGCIPACAISVILHQSRHAPTESDLVRRMWKEQSEGSGFARLNQALADFRVDVEEPSSLDLRLEELTRDGNLVLVAIKRPEVHCIIIERVAEGWVRFHDPGDGASKSAPLNELVAIATGDIAIIYLQ